MKVTRANKVERDLLRTDDKQRKAEKQINATMQEAEARRAY